MADRPRDLVAIRGCALFNNPPYPEPELLRKRYHGRIDAQVSGVAADETDAIDKEAALENASRNVDFAVRESTAFIRSDRLPSIRMRKVHLQQIFQNLISNAIKISTQERSSGNRKSRRGLAQPRIS